MWNCVLIQRKTTMFLVIWVMWGSLVLQTYPYFNPYQSCHVSEFRVVSSYGFIRNNESSRVRIHLFLGHLSNYIKPRNWLKNILICYISSSIHQYLCTSRRQQSWHVMVNQGSLTWHMRTGISRGILVPGELLRWINLAKCT